MSQNGWGLWRWQLTKVTKGGSWENCMREVTFDLSQGLSLSLLGELLVRGYAFPRKR